MRPPGSAGRTVLSDRSVELWRDPAAFVTSGVQQHGSRAFLTRLLLRPTVVLAHNRAVRELLQGERKTGKRGFNRAVFAFYVVTWLGLISVTF